jgi:hypothetical protein
VSYHIDEVIESATGRTLYMFGAGKYRSLLARYTREAAIEDGEEYLAKTGRAHLIEVNCECAEVVGGDACAWSGPKSETVVVEFMPREYRASHEAAGNVGVYPHNGTRRVRCEVSCADRLAHVWIDGEETDTLDPWITVLP